MPEEIRFFGRTAIYAFIIAAIYWFVSYEPVGTIMLAGFGVATGAAFVVLWRGRPRPAAPASIADATADATMLRPDGPFGDESGPVPLRSLAPLEVGFGLAIIGLGLVFGIWFVMAGAIPLAIGAADWLSSARRELRILERSGRRPSPDPSDSRATLPPSRR